MTPTEELRRMLDELGIAWETTEERWNADSITYWKVGGIKWVAFESENDTLWLNCNSITDVTPEQAIAATVGAGMLTAEQVREAIMSADRWRKPMGDTGMTNTHLIIRDDGWQAIADELNATVGAGTCHIEVHDNLAETEGMGDVWLECDECHWQMPLEPTTPRFKYCPNCRREVVSE